MARDRAGDDQRDRRGQLLRARRGRPDAGLRRPQARQLRARRVPHVRRVRGCSSGTRSGSPSCSPSPLGVVATASCGVGLEVVLWRPMRRRRVGRAPAPAHGPRSRLRHPQRRSPSSPGRRTAPRARTSPPAVTLGQLHIGRTELVVTLARVRDARRSSPWRSATRRSGRQVRALSDSIQLAETTGIDTDRIVLFTWARRARVSRASPGSSTRSPPAS